jgi:dynein heavy chain
MTKSIQLYDVTVLRHGLMTVGPTGGGKTMCKNMLANALTKLNKERGEYYEVRQLNMNPQIHHDGAALRLLRRCDA